jgi:cation transport ATPase
MLASAGSWRGVLVRRRALEALATVDTVVHKTGTLTRDAFALGECIRARDFQR